MKVWLDDERPAPPGWRRARTYGEAIALLDTGKVTEMSLDHDLADFQQDGFEFTGYDVLLDIEWSVRHGVIPDPPQLHVHTANPPARKRMAAAIASIERLEAK